jgi:hypothetical protein
VSGDQGSAKVLTFDLSISLLKCLIIGSQSLYRHVRLDEHWASRCQLSVNDQGLVIKWKSRVVHRKKRRLPGIRRTRAGLDLEVPPLWKRVPDPHGGLPA